MHGVSTLLKPQEGLVVMNKKMRDSRRRYGITLKDIANKTFVPLDTLKAWEEGDSVPKDRAAACRVAEMIKCDVSDLYSA